MNNTTTEYLCFDVTRDSYRPGDIKRTMTVGELIDFLEDFNADTPVVLGHDNRYTFGGISSRYANLIGCDEYGDIVELL